jgi:hypothetical protein
MKTVAALTLLVGSAAAFAPQQTSRASTSLAAFENELGAQPPLGFWCVDIYRRRQMKGRGKKESLAVEECPV